MRFKKIILSIILLFVLSFSLSSCILSEALNNFYFGEFTAKEKNKMNSYFGFTMPFCKGYSYQFNDKYAEDHYVLYYISNIHKQYYLNYLEEYNDAEFLGERYDDDYIFKTYYYEDYYTFIDVIYEDAGSLSSSGLWVYMYHRGFVDSYSKYYSNKDHPIDAIPDEIKMSEQVYSNSENINGYANLCPSKGNVKILVVPVDFKDKPASKVSISTITNALTKIESPYPSLNEYYYQSSYKKLNLSFEVVNSWYRAKWRSSQYNSSESISELVNDILWDYDSIYDYNDFDSNKDGVIDGIILVNTLKSSTALDFAWPTTRNNVDYDSSDNPYKFDNVYANRFIHINYDQIMKDNVVDTYALIHEFGHLMGLDDYYDTSYTGRTFLSPLGGNDVMDSSYSDQNAFSKLFLGWIDDAKIINKSKDITLSSFEDTGDIAIISNNFDLTYGPFQEYYIIAYNTGNGLNMYSSCLNKKGIVIYHVDASLYTYQNGMMYCCYNNDQAGITSDLHNLIEAAKKDYNPYVIYLGEEHSTSFSVKDNNGLPLNISITVQGADLDSITLHIEKN